MDGGCGYLGGIRFAENGKHVAVDAGERPDAGSVADHVRLGGLARLLAVSGLGKRDGAGGSRGIADRLLACPVAPNPTEVDDETGDQQHPDHQEGDQDQDRTRFVVVDLVDPVQDHHGSIRSKRFVASPVRAGFAE